jgi:HAD superfamily hydrolase (TIGR01509 family)
VTRLALLFDLDGTLVESDPLHLAAFNAVLAPFGRTLDMDGYQTHVMGRPNSEIMARLLPGESRNHEDLAIHKEAMFRDSLPDQIEPVAGIHALLDWSDENGAGLAIVTNAPRKNAEAMLAACGLAGRFETIIIGDECARPKPDPLPFQEAMRALGTNPSRSIAFEDSPSGLRAARASGARVFGLRTGLEDAQLRQAGAHQSIQDFTDPALLTYLQTVKATAA